MASLVRAQRERAVAIGWWSAAIVLLGIAVSSAGLALLIGPRAEGAFTVLGAMAALGLGLAWAARRHALRRNAGAREHLERARGSPETQVPVCDRAGAP